MSLNRLDLTADIQTPQGRSFLHETLELYASEIRRLREEVTAVKEADARVAPVPIEAFPVAAGQIFTGDEGGNVGDVTWRAYGTVLGGELEANGNSDLRSAYPELFSKIGTTWGSVDGTHFNRPNLNGRSVRGRNGSTAVLGATIGSTGGNETSTLTTTELPAHTHTGPSHTHDLGNHTHDLGSHTHDQTSFLQDAGGTAGARIQQTTVFNGASGVTHTSTGPSTNTSGTPSTNTSGAAGTGATGSTGSGGSFSNVPPVAVGLWVIRYRSRAEGTIQTLPIGWGGVNAQWRLDTFNNFPTIDVQNNHIVIFDVNRPEAVVKITAGNGTASGTGSENKIIGVAALPYNFRGWKTEGFKVRTRVNMVGVAGGSTATVRLKISDPITAGAFLSQTYSRTISESGGNITEANFVNAQMNKDKLGPDWKPGYLFRFELSWELPNTFTSASIEVGFMKVSW